jgi:hypothetical protein
MIIGNFILLKLFIAVLIDSFNKAGEEILEEELL